MSEKSLYLTASEPRGNSLKRFEELCLIAKARVWPWLSYMRHIRSTAGGLLKGFATQEPRGELVKGSFCYVYK